MEPKKVIQALEDPSWIEAMQEELLQFQLQKVWTLVNLPNGKRAIGTKWVFRNKKDERGIVMDVKSAFLYGTIEEEVYVDDIIFGLTKKSLCDEFEGLMNKRFRLSSMGERSDLLFNDEDGIACLTNDEIFENFALMGYEQLSTKLTFQKVSHELQTEAHIEQILPSPSTYQRQQRKTQKHRRAKKVTELPQTSMPLDHGADEAIHKKGVTGALAQTRSERVLEKPNEPPLTKGHTSGSGEGNMKHTFKLMDTIPPTPYNSPLSGGNTPGSDEGRMELIQELMETYTLLTKRVLALEESKRSAQGQSDHQIETMRVKRLEKKRKARTPQPMKRRLFKGRVESFDDDLDEEDASKQGRESDKTKSIFQDSDFDVLNNDMEDVEGETVHTAITGVSIVSAPVTTTSVAISTAEH
ncbi:hypothetical protein Tco_0295606 [Tanacetum coccineum]